jgi:hypothetical protein
MKKKFYLANVFAILLFHMHLWAQPCPILSHIEDSTALHRIAFFEKVKKDIINPKHKILVNVEPILISKDVMIGLLNDIKLNHDGARVYLVLTDKNADEPYRLTLALVPTIGSGIADDNGDEISDDDSKQYVLINGKFIPENTATVMRWKNRYQNVATRIKNELLKRYNIVLEETQSLWYSKEVLFYKTPDGDDLLTYLNDCGNVHQIEIHFASWTFEPDNIDDLKYVFKTDLIFKLIDLNKSPNNNYFTLGSVEIAKKLPPDKFLYSGYTNTGLPCPPNKCP